MTIINVIVSVMKVNHKNLNLDLVVEVTRWQNQSNIINHTKQTYDEIY